MEHAFADHSWARELQEVSTGVFETSEWRPMLITWIPTVLNCHRSRVDGTIQASIELAIKVLDSDGKHQANRCSMHRWLHVSLIRLQTGSDTLLRMRCTKFKRVCASQVSSLVTGVILPVGSSTRKRMKTTVPSSRDGNSIAMLDGRILISLVPGDGG